MARVERTLKVFVSSPGDAAEERVLATYVFKRLVQEFRDTGPPVKPEGFISHSSDVWSMTS
jgi:hypothetical protein